MASTYLVFPVLLVLPVFLVGVTGATGATGEIGEFERRLFSVVWDAPKEQK